MQTELKEDIVKYLRNVHLICDVATSVLHNVLETVYKKNDFPTFREFMDNQDTKCCLSHLRRVKACCLCSNDKFSGFLTESQWKALYDIGDKNVCTQLLPDNDHCCNIKAKVTDLNRLDLRLCSVILTNVKSVKSLVCDHHLQCIRELRHIRNEIFGRSVPPAEKSEKQRETILYCINGLAEICGKMRLDDYIEKGDNFDLKEMLTSDQVNFIKMTYAIVEIGGNILCKMLELSAKRKRFPSFMDMLDNKEIKCEIFHLRKVKKCCICGRNNLKGPLSIYQWGILYKIPSRKAETCKPAVPLVYHNCQIKARDDVMDNIDVSLATLLLMNLHSWSSESLREVQEDLKKLRTTRNYILGSPVSISLSEDIFTSKLNDLRTALTKLAGFTGDDKMIQTVHEFFRENKILQSGDETYRVRFEFPPSSLSMYDYARSKVKRLIKEMEKQTDGFTSVFDCDNYDLFVLHADKIKVEQFCLEYFNAEATVEKFTTDPISSSLQSCVVIKLLCNGQGSVKSLGVQVLTLKPERKMFPIGDEAGRKYIYDNLYTVLRQKIRCFRKSEEKLYEVLETIENECYCSQNTGSWEVPESTAERLQRLMPHDVKCYSIRNGKLTIYIDGEKETEIYKEMSEDSNLKDMKWKLIPMSDKCKITPFYRPGKALYRTRDKFEGHFGTLGLYAKLNSTSEPVAITAGHVAFRDVECFVVTSNSDSMERLGICSWPPLGDNIRDLNIRDLAVIRISNSTVKEFCESQSQTERQVRVFEGQRQHLDKRKIFKVGAKTGTTYGYIIEPCMVIPFSNHVYNAILIEEVDGKDFAGCGDSGAIIFLPEGNYLQAVSILIGEHEIPDHPKACISSRMKEAMDNYEQNLHDRIIITRDNGIYKNK